MAREYFKAVIENTILEERETDTSDTCEELDMEAASDSNREFFGQVWF